MATILRPLSNGLYTSGKAVGHFYPHAEAPYNDDVPAKGYRFGDWDELSINVEVGEETTRQSKEHNVPTTVLSTPGDISVTVSATVAQLSDFVRAASLMGNNGVRSQEARTGVVKTLTEAGVYYLGHYGITNISAEVDGAPAELGTDYMIDAISGQVETLVPGVEITYDAPALSSGFMSGIASSTGVRGMIIVRMVNKQGVRSIVRLHDVELRPAGARQLVIDGTETSTIQLTGTAYPVAGKPVGQEIGYEMDISAETVGGI